MILIDNTIVSDELLEKKFVCALSKCKGACCVQGENGAPLEESETEILQNIFSEIDPFLTERGKTSINKFGKFTKDEKGNFATPLVNGNEECAYTVFENGIAQCGIEKAFHAGKINFRKPVSCFLYPVRVKTMKDRIAVNFDEWEICTPACKQGEELGIPVYQFLKEPLIEKFGEEWFKQLEGAAEVFGRQGTETQ